MRGYGLVFLLFSHFLFAQNPQERHWIKQQYKDNDTIALQRDFQNYLLQDLQSIESAKNKGHMPLHAPRDTGYSLQRINEDGVAIYYSLNNKQAIGFSLVNYLHQANNNNLTLQGENMIIGILDGDVVLDTHVEFSDDKGKSRAVLLESPKVLPLENNKQYRQIINRRNHATHVGGTLIGRGRSLEAKGAAPKASLYSYNWTNDIVKIVELAAKGILVSNHSYGIATVSEQNTSLIPAEYFGVYSREALSYDRVMREYPYYQSVIASGNDRKDYSILNPNKKGFDLLLGYSIAKNPIVVGAIIAQYRDNQVHISNTDFSNYGPTADFRIKPDIVASGVGLYSSIYRSTNFSQTPGSNTLYAFSSGTSMSTPVVSGILTLWQQWALLNYNYPYKAASIKALMIHSADKIDGDIKPNVKYGWGVINAKNGVEFLENTKLGKALLTEHTLYDAQSYQTQIVLDKDASRLSFTLVWNDLPGQDKIANKQALDSPDLIHDLDLRVIDQDGQEYFPWYLNKDYSHLVALQGDNNVDNIEKIDIVNAKKGTYQIIVSSKNLLHNQVQDFSLLVSDEVFSGLKSESKNENSYNLNFDSWPNPAKYTLFIEIPKEIVFVDKNLEVYNSKGQLVEFKQIKSTDRFELDVSTYVKGIYFLVIKSNFATYKSKFIKS